MTEEQILDMLRERVRQWRVLIANRLKTDADKEYARMHINALLGVIDDIEHGYDVEEERKLFNRLVKLI